LKLQTDISQWAERIIAEIEKAFLGKRKVIEKILVAVLAGGHILLEDVPGVGKTILARAVAKCLGGSFSRIQATADLLPTDILGVSIYHPENKSFRYHDGPILSNIVLVDEINRATPRAQSALLEAMAERQISIEGKSIPLPEPFMLIATENPIDFEGTFPLPEAQKDRFLICLTIGYPDPESEEQIIISQRQETHPVQSIQTISNGEEIRKLQSSVHAIHLDKTIMHYILQLTTATREHSLLKLGVSPRGSLSLSRASQALAAIKGRDYVIPDDIKTLCKPVFKQRMLLKPESLMRGLSAESIIDDIIENSKAPIPENP